MTDIEDDRPEPDSLAAIAAEHGVDERMLRAVLRESHPDASPAEVIALAREMGGDNDPYRWYHRCPTPECCHHRRHHVIPRADCADCRAEGWTGQGSVPPRAGARPRGHR